MSKFLDIGPRWVAPVWWFELARPQNVFREMAGGLLLLISFLNDLSDVVVYQTSQHFGATVFPQQMINIFASWPCCTYHILPSLTDALVKFGTGESMEGKRAFCCEHFAYRGLSCAFQYITIEITIDIYRQTTIWIHLEIIVWEPIVVFAGSILNVDEVSRAHCNVTGMLKLGQGSYPQIAIDWRVSAEHCCQLDSTCTLWRTLPW